MDKALNKSVKEKLRNCRSEAEMQKATATAGLQELSLEMLEGVSGGNSVSPEGVPGENTPVPPIWFMKDE